MGPSVRRSFFALVWLVFASVFGAGVKSDASGSIEATLPQSATVGSVAPAQDAVARLHALFDREWERSMREQPTWASSLGDRRYNDRWPDESLDAIERRQREDVAVLEELATIDRDSLPADEQLNYDLFRLEYEEKVEGQQFHSFLIPLSERGGIQTADGLHEILRFETAKDFEDWIARLHRIGPYVDQTLALMERGLAEAWVPPRITMEGVTEQIAAQVVDSPEKSPFYDPFEIFPADFPEQEQERLRAAGIAAISEIVIPAYRRLQTFYTERYLPGIRETVGAWDLPGGSAFYSHQAWASTTTRLTPEEIHEIGLGEVERIHIEMERIMAEVGFQGTFEEFLDFLRTDRRFYYEKPEDLFDGYLTICKRIDPELVKLFGRLPRAPYGVRAIPRRSPRIRPPRITTLRQRTEVARDGST